MQRLYFSMKRSKVYISVFYLSILFAIIYLINNDYFSLSMINFNTDLLISLFFLSLGFMIYSLTLQIVIRSQNEKVSFQNCLISIGNTIFSKYIPGKVAMIYAMAYKLNEKENNTNVTRLSYLILLFQVLIIVSGLLTGLFFIFQIDDIPAYLKIGSILIIISSVIILQSKSFFFFVQKLLTKKLKKEITLPPFSKVSILKIIFTSVLFWISWGIGIYFFINSLGIEIENQFALIFLYSFSICIGILSVITPGGIGVREGVLAFFIIAFGNPVAIASEISVLSRLWFISGEIIFFFISMIVPYLYKKNTKRKI